MNATDRKGLLAQCRHQAPPASTISWRFRHPTILSASLTVRRYVTAAMGGTAMAVLSLCEAAEQAGASKVD
ncbi:MAG TPA: hypothetical protein VKG91_16145, partial [Roseiarcus sp.]|nr:hypothetical protein [Roseiarcus sp.]